MSARPSRASALLALLAPMMLLLPAAASHGPDATTTASTGRKLPSLPLPAPYSIDYDPMMDPLDAALSSLDTAGWIDKELHRSAELSAALGSGPQDTMLDCLEPALAVISLTGTTVGQVRESAAPTHARGPAGRRCWLLSSRRRRWWPRAPCAAH
jgi:hypothetical protein